MNAKKRPTAIDNGITFLDGLMQSAHQDEKRKLVEWIISGDHTVPMVDFATCPIYAVWCRMEIAGWYALARMGEIETNFDLDDFQHRYDVLLRSNSSTGLNRLIKVSYDLLYQERSDTTFSEMGTGANVPLAIWLAVKACVDDKVNIKAMVEALPASDRRIVTSAISTGYMEDNVKRSGLLR